MLSVLTKRFGSALLVPGSLDDIGSDGWSWIDVINPTGVDISTLTEHFDLDPLVIEDLGEATLFPKLDDFSTYVFCVMHTPDVSGDRVLTNELDVLLYSNALVTLHRQHVPVVESMIQHAQVTPGFADGGPDRMFARIAELTGRSYLPLLDHLDVRIEELEEASLRGDPQIIADVQRLRSDTSRIRRVVAPQREVLRSLSEGERGVIGARAARRFSSVYDHHHRVVESLDSARVLLGSVMDTYRSTVAERTNEVMKVLTVFSAILLPLSLLAGIYGMNFANMPELQWHWGYFALIGAMAVAAASQWLYFVRRGFIGRAHIRVSPRSVGRGLAVVAKAPIKVLSGFFLPANSED